MNRAIANRFFSLIYRKVVKPVFFLLTPDFIHEKMVSFGEFLGKSTVIKGLFSIFFNQKNNSISQKILGISFASPVGLSAGFDYEAKLTQIVPSLGFGFQTIGTITFNPYMGNQKPMLGRLPKSKSLMVNKGFKNPGAYVVAKKLQRLPFIIPVGISIGRTNSPTLTQEESVEDIMNACKIFEYASLKNSYYELNISCPNLFGQVTFYTSKNLEALLRKIDTLKIKKPIFVKMPISESKKTVLELLKVISRHKIKGVIFGNLQKKTNNKYFDSTEMNKFSKGGFSGKPTYEKSNEYIKLAYKHFHNRFIIIGTGGIFSAHDAYEKIKNGASLVQLITGLIFEGPQLVAEINDGLADLLKKDGFTNITQAIGKDVKK